MVKTLKEYLELPTIRVGVRRNATCASLSRKVQILH